MSNQRITMFCTKRLWTQGIEELVGWVNPLEHFVPEGFSWIVKIGLDAFHTREDAVKRAEYLRVRRVQKLRRDLEETEAFDFENVRAETEG